MGLWDSLEVRGPLPWTPRRGPPLQSERQGARAGRVGKKGRGRRR